MMSLNADKHQWQQSEDEIIRENWGKLSSGQIAQLIPQVSKSAIIGRAHRIGAASKKEPAQ